MIRVCAVLAVGALAACFSPSVDQCAVLCSAAGECPPALSCLSDNYCHVAMTEALCGARDDASIADAVPGAPDADPNAPDADPAAPDATPGPPSPTAAGDLVVTEIMKDPCVAVAANCTVVDNDGEWFEVHNPTSGSFELQGLLVRDDSGEQFQINSSVIIAAGAHVVLGRNDDIFQNGGAPVDFVYTTNFFLSNSSNDEIEIVNIAANPDVVIDRVQWNTGGFPPGGQGEALSLDPGSYDATANDNGLNWCVAPGTFGGGDNGSPGSVNPTCP